MYAPFFGLTQKPFSIAPDPRYLFMSERHREALAHLLYGVQGGGGFVLLTGEIGAGKTTVCRCFLEQVPARSHVAYIFNPKLTVIELLTTIGHEFGVEPPAAAAPTVKDHVDALNAFLLRSHAAGQNNLLIIDEAQNLSADVLEQLRLLTNLETNERKLLQIVLIGQPELRAMLARPELEQLAQRVIARYHLEALSEQECAQYIAHRLAVSGLKGALPFDAGALRRIHQLARGVPRRINLLCDRAMLGAYASGQPRIDRTIVDKAAAEVFGPQRTAAPARRRWPLALGVGVCTGVVAAAATMGAARWNAPLGLQAGAAVASAAGGRPAASAASAGRAAAAGTLAANASAPSTLAASTAGVAAAATAGAAPASGASAASSFTFAGPSAAGSAGPRLRSIDDLETALARAPRDDRDALRQLAPAWQIELAADADPCDAAERQGVLCYRTHGGLSLLRLLARPSVLALRDARDRPVYVVLASLGRDDATLLVGKTTLSVPLTLLTTAWRGDFVTLWRPPAGYAAPLAVGARGKIIDLVAARLAALQGAVPPEVGQPYDAALKARVNAFQLAQGLTPDGVAGPTTLMQLNRLGGVAEPWLAGVAAGPAAAPVAAVSAQRK